LRIGYWHYQKIGVHVRAGEKYKGKFRYAYQRRITGSPFNPGGRWWIMYPGKWPMIGCIDGKYYTQEVTITRNEVGKSDFTFNCPAGGTLEYILFYLYDRTKQTPKSVFTPMDIYRQSILQKKHDSVLKNVSVQ